MFFLTEYVNKKKLFSWKKSQNHCIFKTNKNIPTFLKPILGVSSWIWNENFGRRIGLNDVGLLLTSRYDCTWRFISRYHSILSRICGSKSWWAEDAFLLLLIEHVGCTTFFTYINSSYSWFFKFDSIDEIK
jgi:hypothetical protein